MAYLDVSDVLLDPEIADKFSVIRRRTSNNTYGEVSNSASTFNGVIGVVTSSSPNDLMRLADDQLMGRHLTIVTRFRLYGPAKNATASFQPDIVVWMGDQFVVKNIDPYPQYGAGFVQAIVGSIDPIDMPTPEPAE